MQQEHTIDLGSGRTLHARQFGRGPDLVLVHGAMTTTQDWLASTVAAGLRHHRVTIVDRPGHGLSKRPRFAGTPREQADQIAEGLERLGVRRAVFAAHSYGCLIALALAERHPETVAGLVLVAPLAFPETRLLEHSLLAPRAAPVVGPLFSQFAAFTQLDRPMVEALQKIMFSPAEVPSAWKETYPYALILEAEAMVMEGEDAASIHPLSAAGAIDMRGIRARAAVLTGTADRVVEDERQAKLLARQLPDARLVEVEGAGHMLHHSHAGLVLAEIEAAFAAA